MKPFSIVLLTLAAAIPSTWFAVHQFDGTRSTAAHSGGDERKVLFYQSAMHPWVKSDKPGRCTICGMELTPVFEGQQGVESSGDVVSLGQSTIQVLHVETAEAKRQPLERTLPVAGMIDDNQTRHRILSAYVDGRVDKLIVNYLGAEVEAGQPLAHLYSPTLIAARDEYLLVLRQPASPTRERLLDSARERLIRLGLTAEQIARMSDQKSPPNHLEILAPIGGTVVAQNVYEGQYVKEGERLFEIADFSTMWFQFRAYEQDLPWVKIGQEVEVSTPSHPGQVFTGTISFIDPNFDEATRSTKVRVELPNPMVDGRRVLLHRLYADGLLRIEADKVLAVPRAAIVQTGPEAVVYVDRGEGTYERSSLQLGRRGDSLVEVLSGLKEGDKVVTNGNLLIDGQAEMNRSFAPADEAVPDSAPAGKALTDAQRLAVEEFTLAADRIAIALAADDLAAFNKTGPGAMPATERLVAALKERAELASSVQKLVKASHLHEAVDLAAARKAYHAFVTAAASVVTPLRRVPGAPQFMVWECPMVDEAVPGAPKKGRWIQAANRGIGNPFFGSEMLECGVEVK